MTIEIAEITGGQPVAAITGRILIRDGESIPNPPGPVVVVNLNNFDGGFNLVGVTGDNLTAIAT